MSIEDRRQRLGNKMLQQQKKEEVLDKKDKSDSEEETKSEQHNDQGFSHFFQEKRSIFYR